MVALGYADGMVTGVTRNFSQALDEVMNVIDPAPGGRVMGMSIVLTKGRTLFIADTNVTEMPEADDLMEIAVEAAATVRHLGYKPRVAFLSYSSFGNPMGERSEKVREAVAMLDEMDELGFEYEGEMPPELALEMDAREGYPFMRLSGPANVLVMPAIHSASISTKLLASVGAATVVGPILVGLAKPVQICPLGAPVTKILMMAQMAAYGGQLAAADPA
jgi:malate dehydrogenase (oxaloacetate-decarboxylating)(NADP+)